MKKMNESMITKILADHPNQIFTYNYFSSLFDAGKSSVCEDISIVKKAFENLEREEFVLFSVLAEAWLIIQMFHWMKEFFLK